MLSGMTKRQRKMPADFTQMSIGDLARALELLENMVKNAPRKNNTLSEPCANITIPLMLLARAMNVEYHRSIEIRKINSTLQEVRECISALVEFAREMYPKTETKSGKVRHLRETGTEG